MFAGDRLTTARVVAARKAAPLAAHFAIFHKLEGTGFVLRQAFRRTVSFCLSTIKGAFLFALMLPACRAPDVHLPPLRGPLANAVNSAVPQNYYRTCVRARIVEDSGSEAVNEVGCTSSIGNTIVYYYVRESSGYVTAIGQYWQARGDSWPKMLDSLSFGWSQLMGSPTNCPLPAGSGVQALRYWHGPDFDVVVRADSNSDNLPPSAVIEERRTQRVSCSSRLLLYPRRAHP